MDRLLQTQLVKRRLDIYHCISVRVPQVSFFTKAMSCRVDSVERVSFFVFKQFHAGHLTRFFFLVTTGTGSLGTSSVISSSFRRTATMFGRSLVRVLQQLVRRRQKTSLGECSMCREGLGGVFPLIATCFETSWSLSLS